MMHLLWYSCDRWSNNTRCKCGYCHPIHPHHLGVDVYVFVQGAYICAHDTPRLSASSKALSGALCGPRSLRFHSPFFCLSVSYLIALAQKQSRDRYLRLRVKAYWCLGEVSPQTLSLLTSLPLPFQENIWAADQREPQWHPPILLGQDGRWDTPFSIFADTLSCF